MQTEKIYNYMNIMPLQYNRMFNIHCTNVKALDGHVTDSMRNQKILYFTMAASKKDSRGLFLEHHGEISWWLKLFSRQLLLHLRSLRFFKKEILQVVYTSLCFNVAHNHVSYTILHEVKGFDYGVCLSKWRLALWNMQVCVWWAN